uniref:protein-serine/threonine phosphatase n=1 Tax=Oryza punctata TaxID=4537 RepID=A0A0E0KCN5_ORYPU
MESASGEEGKAAPSLPLATLIGRELRGGGSERPLVRYGHFGFAKRGEDYFLVKPDCLRVPGDPSSAFSVFAVFDGHNGVSAAVFSKEHLLEHVMSAVPQGIGRDDWLQALPRALVAGFVKTDIDFQRKGEASGTTATLVVVDGFTVTVASVGDSRCILDTQGGVISLLTVDHRLEENVEERERVTASGGEVSRLNLCGGQEVGPLRCWPGGLCLSRSIGDTDVGEFIVPIPHVKQVKLSNAGGRLIIASDGIWDALSSEAAAQACRGLPAELAAKLVVKQALKTSGLKDDTTCVVVDIIPSDHSSTPPSLSPKKNQNKLRSLIFGRRSHSSVGKLGNKSASFDSVEELFEEGSAMLGRNFPSKANLPPFRCAICQVDQAPFEDLVTDNGGGCCSAPSTQRGGPYLCSDCRKKKDAMEGKRSSRSTACRIVNK